MSSWRRSREWLWRCRSDSPWRRWDGWCPDRETARPATSPAASRPAGCAAAPTAITVQSLPPLPCSTRRTPASAVDFADLQTDGLRSAKARRISRRQCGARRKARHRLKEADNLVGAENHRQRAWRTGIGDPLRDLGMTQRHAVEVPQRTHRLVQRPPRDSGRNHMHLEGVDILQTEPVRRVAEVAGKLRHRMYVGLLRGRGTDCGSSCPRSCAGEAGSTRPSLLLFLRLRFNSRNPFKTEASPVNPPARSPRQRLRCVPSMFNRLGVKGALANLMEVKAATSREVHIHQGSGCRSGRGAGKAINLPGKGLRHISESLDEGTAR